jgi:hypothetical protein
MRGCVALEVGPVPPLGDHDPVAHHHGTVGRAVTAFAADPGQFQCAGDEVDILSL